MMSAAQPMTHVLERPRSTPVHDELAGARERFLRSRIVSPIVRPEIAASWRRSLLCGVSPRTAEPEYLADVAFDCQLTRVAKPVLEDREQALADTCCAIVLTDADARVLARWGDDPRLEWELTHHGVMPGHCFAESVVGTNSAALALETGQPSEVHGAEHFLEGLLEFSSTGAPVVHPLSRRVLGTLNIVCRRDAANPLQRLWLLEIVREMERRLRVEACAEEQLLLESFMSARRDSRHPVVCLNDQTILSNAAAARLLGTVDQALLWEQASRAIREHAYEVSTFTLKDGHHLSAHCRPIYDGQSAVGAMIEIQVTPGKETRAARRAKTDAAQPLDVLAGHSDSWRRLCGEVSTAKARGERLLLVGEPGTGKRATAEALYAGGQVDVFDAALLEVEGSGQWVRRLHERLQDDRGAVIIVHLESLDVFSARTVSSLIERVAATGPAIVGTLNDGAGSQHQVHGALAHFGTVVRVPALRDRIEDLRDLLQVLTARHAAPGAAWQWMPDAVQTLSRVEWSSNVRALEHIVRQVVNGRVGGYVDARSLPASVRAAGTRRRLTRLEQLEAAAITEALQHSRGNKLEAAERLGIARSTLYRRMRTLGLDLTEANY